MATFFTMERLTVHVEQNRIDVTSSLPTPNSQWRHTDTNGHEHHYDHGYPTLDLVVDDSHWCDGHEGAFNHDPHEAVDASHYECNLCRETIEPSLDPPFTYKSMPGRIDATGSGTRTDGVTITFAMNEDDIARYKSGMDADAQQAMLDSVPDDRILHASWSSD